MTEVEVRLEYSLFRRSWERAISYILPIDFARTPLGKDDRSRVPRLVMGVAKLYHRRVFVLNLPLEEWLASENAIKPYEWADQSMTVQGNKGRKALQSGEIGDVVPSQPPISSRNSDARRDACLLS